MKYNIDVKALEDEVVRVKLLAASPDEKTRGVMDRFTKGLRERGIPIKPVIEALAEAQKEATT